MPEFSEMWRPTLPPPPQGKQKNPIEDLPQHAETFALTYLKYLEEIWKIIMSKGIGGCYYKKDWVSKKYFIDLVIEKMKEMNIED